MRTRSIALPELALISATRGMLGLGIGFLVGPRLSADRRKLAGTVLVLIGAISTLPLALRVFGRRATNSHSRTG